MAQRQRVAAEGGESNRAVDVARVKVNAVWGSSGTSGRVVRVRVAHMNDTPLMAMDVLPWCLSRVCLPNEERAWGGSERHTGAAQHRGEREGVRGIGGCEIDGDEGVEGRWA